MPPFVWRHLLDQIVDVDNVLALHEFAARIKFCVQYNGLYYSSGGEWHLVHTLNEFAEKDVQIPAALEEKLGCLNMPSQGEATPQLEFGDNFCGACEGQAFTFDFFGLGMSANRLMGA